MSLASCLTNPTATSQGDALSFSERNTFFSFSYAQFRKLTWEVLDTRLCSDTDWDCTPSFWSDIDRLRNLKFKYGNVELDKAIADILTYYRKKTAFYFMQREKRFLT